MTRIGIDARKIADYGIGTYIRGLLGGLAELSPQEEIVVFAPARARERILTAFEHIVVDAPHYSVRELLVIGQSIRRAQVDLFHAPHYVTPLTSARTVVTIHDLIHLNQPQRNPAAPLYARMMIGRAFAKASRVLTVSEAVKRQLAARYGNAEKIVVTPNGIDARFTAAGPRANGRYVLFAGNDKPHKNVETVVDAIARVDGVQLVLAGGDFARFASRERVVISGFVSDDELAALYRGAMAVVVPSREEGFGLPAAEAMACGAAVITSDAAALIEVTGDAALHVEALDVIAWADAIARIAGDESLRRDLAARGVSRAAGFTWRACAEATLRTYREALFS
ncbi:MAG TPA: glycosyltransferase family 1 protein [Thermoanaerobaculia bacterium]|nr:glycosyltransferase family 1 protein [Thermoanaerobaculia bacterium]